HPGGTDECSYLVLPQRLRPSPEIKWVGVPLLPANTIFRGFISRLQLFRYVQASEIACLPDRSHRCKYPCRAAKAFTSEQNVRRYLRTHRICYPPDYRQLAERGLSPRKIHSIVDCSSHSRSRGSLHFRLTHAKGVGARRIVGPSITNCFACAATRIQSLARFS